LVVASIGHSGIATQAWRRQLQPQFEASTATSSILSFYHLSGFPSILIELLLLLREKRVGSAYLHLVFVRQRLGTRFGSPTPSPNDKSGSIKGPVSQIK